MYMQGMYIYGRAAEKMAEFVKHNIKNTGERRNSTISRRYHDVNELKIDYIYDLNLRLLQLSGTGDCSYRRMLRIGCTAGLDAPPVPRHQRIDPVRRIQHGRQGKAAVVVQGHGHRIDHQPEGPGFQAPA